MIFAFQEIVAVAARMGVVNSGLTDEVITQRLRPGLYRAPENTPPEDAELCSICLVQVSLTSILNIFNMNSFMIPFSSLVRLILLTRMCLEKSTAPTNFTMNASNSGSSTRTFVHSAGKSQSNSQIKHEGFPS